MAEGASIKSHIDEFSTNLMDLENIEISYDDEDEAFMLLRSLPSSYKHFRDTLIYSRQTLKLEDVKAALFSKELIDKELGTSRNDSPAEGLLVRGRTLDKSSFSNQRSRSRSKSRHKNLTCNYCKKKGHIKSECFKLKNKQQNKDQKRDEPAEASVTPENVRSGKPTEYSDLKVFGYPAYAHVNDNVNDDKLEPRSKRCIFIGYPYGVKGYKL
ncbi:hypothetical protein ACOSP7_026443 [Xanthoceras sorbifolium]